MRSLTRLAWKHAALTEVLERERPRRYAETHAGSGAYPIVREGERQFGVLRFLDVAARSEVLARCRYRAVAAFWLNGRGLYSGSALLAMTVLGDASSYLLCDLDPGSAADLRRRARELSLSGCEVAEVDGMAAVAAWLDRHAALFLACDEARFITGLGLPLDAGAMLR